MALEEVYKLGVDRKVTLFLSCIVPLVIASVLELIDCSPAGKSFYFSYILSCRYLWYFMLFIC